jgi:poly-beta-hydroxybutyrate-responsive repressor
MAANSNRDQSEGPFQSPRLHGEMLSASLLAFLRGWNGHGYELAKRLSDAGLPPFDVGTIYRTLRQLEKSGLVSSFWDMSPSGPARRTYSLTQAGETFLNAWSDVLQTYQRVFLSALGPPQPPAKGEGAVSAGE